LPREHHKTLVELASLVPGAERQALHHFLHDAPWEAEALNRRRLQIWQAHPFLGPQAQGVLIVDETGAPKRGHRIELVAQQYLGKLGHVAGGVVSVTSQWTDGTRQVPVGVAPYRPASRLPLGNKDPAFHTKPQLAWTLIQEAQAAGIPFRLVVADSVYGESSQLDAHLVSAGIPYIMGLRPSHGTWQMMEDPRHPPAFTPAEAAARLPAQAWDYTVRYAPHGAALVCYVAELELGLGMSGYGPTKGFRLIAATPDPTTLKADNTGYLATTLPLEEVSPAQVYELYRLRDWIEHYYKPATHELGWADYQVRPERAIVRHGQLVMLASTFSLLVGAVPSSESSGAAAAASSSAPPQTAAGEKIRTHSSTGECRQRVRGAGRLERHPAAGPQLALPLGSAPALLATLGEQRPTARVGSAPRSRRPRPSA
jgi:hypothetical protein